MFSPKEKDFLNSLGLNYNFDNLSEDELIQIEDTISEKLQISGFDENGNINETGIICESILDQLA